MSKYKHFEEGRGNQFCLKSSQIICTYQETEELLSIDTSLPCSHMFSAFTTGVVLSLWGSLDSKIKVHKHFDPSTCGNSAPFPVSNHSAFSSNVRARGPAVSPLLSFGHALPSTPALPAPEWHSSEGPHESVTFWVTLPHRTELLHTCRDWALRRRHASCVFSEQLLYCIWLFTCSSPRSSCQLIELSPLLWAGAQ